MTAVRIPWDELAESPKKAEQLFDLLMHAEYGDRVRTINGAGGDGGCDAWFEDIRRAVEFKSWTKLGNSQRAQASRSLKRASENDIASWVLVAPVHPTPKDWEWFDDLKARYRDSIDLQFLEVRWLEAKLAKYPGIARFILSTPHQEVVDLLRELHQEQAAMTGGVPDLLKRLTVLSTRADELSPIWGVDFASRGGRNEVSVRLQEGIPPQHIEVHLDVPDDPAGSAVTGDVAAALHYGSGTVIEPGCITRVENEAISALNLPWQQVAMVLPDQRVTAGFPRAATLRARTHEGARGRPLHLTLHYATEGSRGMYVHGADSTGMLRVRLRVDRPGQLEAGTNVGVLLQYGPTDTQHAAAVDPEALLRTVNALDSLDHTPGMALTLGTEQIDLDAGLREPTGNFAPISRALQDFIVVRDELDIALPLPAHWSAHDERNIALLAGLLRGDEVAMPLNSTVCHQISTVEEARLYMDLLESGHGGRIEFEIVGLSLPIGQVQVPTEPLYVAFTRAQIANATEVAEAITAKDSAIPVDIRPAPGSTVIGRRTPFPSPGGTSPVM
ncbi:hypothetical protein DL991_10145 [Amycolatopsis sp. WAC 01375]|nr:hypothetical protein DL991_10145 [Amycolatopsis sp. WAC 01375]